MTHLKPIRINRALLGTNTEFDLVAVQCDITNDAADFLYQVGVHMFRRRLRATETERHRPRARVAFCRTDTLGVGETFACEYTRELAVAPWKFICFARGTDAQGKRIKFRKTAFATVTP